jgi:hypothetical protein
MPIKTHPAREAALAAGLSQYNTGEKCSKGHSSARSVSNGNCIVCETTRQWLRRNPGKSLKDYTRMRVRLQHARAEKEKCENGGKHAHRDGRDELPKITRRFLTLLRLEALSAVNGRGSDL